MFTKLSVNGLKRSLKAFVSRHEALVLIYHSTLPARTPLFAVPHHLDGDIFRAQMRHLASSGYNCVSMQQLAEYLHDGHIPPRTVVVTFDDGFYNNYAVAFPILREFGIPATIFIASGYIGSTRLAWPEELAALLALTKVPALQFGEHEANAGSMADKTDAYQRIARHFSTLDANGIQDCLVHLLQQAGLARDDLYRSELYDSLRFMSWDNVREMAESGLISFGSHTINHRRLVHLPPDEAQEEIRQSRTIIQDRLGQCLSFAYPHGRRDKDFNDSHFQMAVAAGYNIVVTADSGTVTTDSDALNLPRVSVPSGCGLEQFDYTLRGGVSFAGALSWKGLMKGMLVGRTH